MNPDPRQCYGGLHAPVVFASRGPGGDSVGLDRVVGALVDGFQRHDRLSVRGRRPLRHSLGTSYDRLLLYAEAREATFKDDAPSYRARHLAAHSIIDDRAPMLELRRDPRWRHSFDWAPFAVIENSRIASGRQ